MFTRPSLHPSLVNGFGLALLLVLECLPRAAATLHFSTFDATASDRTSLTLHPQQSGFAFDLYAALPPASYRTTESSMPENCASYTGTSNTSECTAPDGMSAVAVTFEDCGDLFTVCRCADAQMSMDTALDRLSRVPIGLRRFVGTVLILNATAPHAYTLTNGDIHLFGDCAQDVWVHESTHSFDFATNSPHSSDPGWTQAILADSCAPDNYSLTNQVEDFAQMSVLKTFMLLYDGHLPPGFRADCMSHQLDFMGTLPLYTADALFGNTCDILDDQPGARHSAAPLPTPDPTRTFATVSTTWPSIPSSDTPTTTVSATALGPGPIINDAFTLATILNVPADQNSTTVTPGSSATQTQTSTVTSPPTTTGSPPPVQNQQQHNGAGPGPRAQSSILISLILTAVAFFLWVL